MKQADLNKLLNGILKTAGLNHQWKYASGFLFKKVDPLFFSLIITAQAKQSKISYTLGFKLLAFDELFWEITKLNENSKRPLSFRANGAWTVPTMQVLDGNASIESWNIDQLNSEVSEILANCEKTSVEISQEIHNPDENLRVVERYYSKLKERYPDAVTDIWKERMITSILSGNYKEAKIIACERINNHDGGGFSIGSKSFYQLALEYLEHS